MRTLSMTAAVAALTLATSLTVNAQAPQSPAPTQPPAPAPSDRQAPATDQRPISDSARAAAQVGQTLTITGCLKDEKDVASLKPNVAERAGITNDYVLTNVKTSAGSAVSGLGVAATYEVEGISEDELKRHVNHQVELTGQVVQQSTASSSDAPDFRATGMKMLAATCPAQ